MPRTRSTPDSQDAPAVHIGAVQPPPRKRERKITLAPEVLAALQESISPDSWTSNGVAYGGDDAAKDATTAARVYRRDLARYMNVSERKIRTRVWESDSDAGEWIFALSLRSENGNGNA